MHEAATGQPEEALNYPEYSPAEAGATWAVLLVVAFSWSALLSMAIAHSWPLAWLAGLLLERQVCALNLHNLFLVA